LLETPPALDADDVDAEEATDVGADFFFLLLLVLLLVTDPGDISFKAPLFMARPYRAVKDDWLAESLVLLVCDVGDGTTPKDATRRGAQTPAPTAISKTTDFSLYHMMLDVRGGGAYQAYRYEWLIQRERYRTRVGCGGRCGGR